MIGFVKHIMRHRQVVTPLFPTHRNSTTEPPNCLTESSFFSPALLATVDFETVMQFDVRGKKWRTN